MAELKLLLIIMLLVAVSSAKLAKGPNLNPTITDRSVFKSCQTKAGKSGKCVHESYCDEEHTILPGGNIDSSELRSFGCASKSDLWCCSEERLATPSVVGKSSYGCFAQKEDYCPWCVSLFRGSAMKINEMELFCAGVLIGSKMVLTAATCFIVSNTQMVWARIPDSAEPEINYKVQFRNPHPFYNSGTRENDFAVFILESEVKWNDAMGKSACLGLSSTLINDCFAFGYNSNDQFVSTLLKVSKGSCMKGGSTPDVSCGRPIDDEPCTVATGAPVICPGDAKDLIVVGIARTPCINSSVQLGAISTYATSQWLRTEFSNIGLSDSNYVYQLI